MTSNNYIIIISSMKIIDATIVQYEICDNCTLCIEVQVYTKKNTANKIFISNKCFCFHVLF